MALGLELFGPWDGINTFDVIRSGRLLRIRDIYRIAGTKDQDRLSEADWGTITEIEEALADEERIG